MFTNNYNLEWSENIFNRNKKISKYVAVKYYKNIFTGKEYVCILLYSNPSLSAKVTFQQTCTDNETINQCKK
jgi:hypothetical protein